MSIQPVPPPPPLADSRLLRWFTDVRTALSLEPVRPLALTGNWLPASAPLRPPGYWRQNGLVHLHGAVTDTVGNGLIATLPVGFRPAASARFTVSAGGQLARVEVDSQGQVKTLSGQAGEWVLDGILFRIGG